MPIPIRRLKSITALIGLIFPCGGESLGFNPLTEAHFTINARNKRSVVVVLKIID
jgi:hypothetical protein